MLFTIVLRDLLRVGLFVRFFRIYIVLTVLEKPPDKQ